VPPLFFLTALLELPSEELLPKTYHHSLHLLIFQLSQEFFFIR
jgi:hypothetical protein